MMLGEIAVPRSKTLPRGPKHLSRAMLVIWGCWLTGAAMLGIVNPSLLGQGQAIGPQVSGLLLLVISIALLGILPRPIGLLVVGSLVVRFGLIVADLYFGDQISLPGSGVDSEGFFRGSVRVSQDLSLIRESIYGGVFVKCFGLLFHIIGPDRFFAQFTNVLFGVSAILIVYRSMECFEVTGTVRIRVTAIASFLPYTLVLSSIFLRESIIVLIIAVSVYMLARWFVGLSSGGLMLAVICVLAASTFHAGVAVLAVGYLLIGATYRPDTRRFGMSARGIGYVVQAPKVPGHRCAQEIHGANGARQN